MHRAHRWSGCCKIRTALVSFSVHKMVGCKTDDTHKSAKIIPDLGDVGIQSDGTRVSIQCVAILVDLVVENTDRTPESGIAAITIDSLLVCFVCLGILLL